MRKAIEIAKMLEKSSKGTTEEDLIKWAEEIMKEIQERYWKSSTSINTIIEEVKKELK